MDSVASIMGPGYNFSEKDDDRIGLIKQNQPIRMMRRESIKFIVSAGSSSHSPSA